ncbi:MAG: hypothetical protein JO061_02610, partial [Acidobacteriaceae bacterium]|nr:hypothetical protein [Acidobacteriaceae bacterium]
MRVLLRTVAIGLGLIAVTVVILSIVGVRYAYEPSASAVISRYRPTPEAADLWGRPVERSESRTPGVVIIDDELLRLGRKEFYKETFGNEVFLTDIVGILDGPLGVANVLEALITLNGHGTTNLRVRVPESVVIGGHRFQEGSYFDTGLDVPKGSWAPLGLAISFSGWKLRAGITCAACHATVDPVTLKVVEGAPNQDLNAGLLLALASNSSAYFMHTDVRPLRDVPLTNTKRGPLPDTKALEDAVDSELLMWPRGNFDSLTDMKADPTQLPT